MRARPTLYDQFFIVDNPSCAIQTDSQSFFKPAVGTVEMKK